MKCMIILYQIYKKLTNDISSIIKIFGTENFDDLITICFGSDFIKTIINDTNIDKYNLIRDYVNLRVIK